MTEPGTTRAGVHRAPRVDAPDADTDTHRAASPVAPVTDDAGDTTIPTLRAAVLILARRLRYQQANDDISSAEAAVLGRLGHGPLTPGHLARAEHVRPPSMTRTIERLQERGYVQRESDPQDGRQVLVRRTPAGDAFTERSRQLRTAWLAGQFDQLAPADRRILRQAADALRRLSDLP